MKYSYFFQQATHQLFAAVAGLFLALLLLLSGPAAWAQAPAWQSAVAITTSATGAAYSNAVATDAAGNVYVAGQFSGTVSLGSFSFTSPANAGNNGFVAKWSPTTKTFSWARQVGGVVSGIAVVGNSVYATGYFSNTASFGSTVLISAGDYDVFVIKLVDAGSSSTVSWVQQAGGPGADQAQTLAASGSAVYVAGQFNQTITVGATSLTSGNVNNTFLAKLTDSGSTAAFTWAQQVGGSTANGAYGLAVVGANVYLAGYFSQTASFGSTMLATTAGASAYIAKLADAGTTGSFSWAQAPVTASNDMYALGLTAIGTSVYVVGKFTGTASFGTQVLTTAGLHDIFVTKLTDAGGQGSFTWAQSLGGSDEDGAQKVTVVGSQVYVAGSFRGTAGFGATSLTSNGAGDIFVTKLTDAGTSANIAWTQQAGGFGNDNGRAIALSGTAAVVAGSFNGTASFGSQAITNTSTVSENAFLALLASEVLATASPATKAAIAVFPNPAHASATAQIPAGATSATLALLDGLGRIVRTAIAPAGAAYPLDLTGLAPGVYALRVQAGETQAVHRLVVE